MSTITLPPSTKSTLTTSALDALDNGAYISAGIIDLSAVDPIEVEIEVEVTPGTVSGTSPRLSVFVKKSSDNTKFTTGPETGTTTTDEPNLIYLGYIPLNSNSTLQRGSFPVKPVLGSITPYLKVIVKNESGATLAASGHAVYYTTTIGNSTGTVGTVGIDQTTPGTTDSVTVKASAGIGSLTETAPATDTASSGLNGRLQRVSQNITSLIELSTPAFTPTVDSEAGVLPLANTDYTIIGANATRGYLLIQNTHATATLYINPLGSAYVGGPVGIKILAGEGIAFDIKVPNTAVHASSEIDNCTIFVLEG